MTEEARSEMIEKVVRQVMKKLPAEEAPLVAEFVRQYYNNISPDELAARSTLDLYGAVVSHWHYIYQRKPGECKVRVYNPQFEQHGWQSTHTVIEVVDDNMPFVLDSVRLVLTRQELNIHLLIHNCGMLVCRDAEGRITKVLPPNSKDPSAISEAPIYIEIDRISDPEVLESLAQEIAKVLADVRVVVEDWQAMRQKVVDIIATYEKNPPPVPEAELKETLALLDWLKSDHFTFLAYREYGLVGEGPEEEFKVDRSQDLGLFKRQTESETERFADLPVAAQEMIHSPHLLLMGKSVTKSTVHRYAYMDFVSFKDFDANGRVVGERRFIGLYTSVAYNRSPLDIPVVRKKVEEVIAQSVVPGNNYNERAMLNIIETLPRDELFQATSAQLLELCLGIFRLQEKQKITLFIRKDVYGKYFSCLVYVPREMLTSELRTKMQVILLKALGGREISFSTRFSESILARIHFEIRGKKLDTIKYDSAAIEAKLIEAARTWHDDLRDALDENYGEEKANELLKRYRHAFPAGYQETFTARTAVVDIEHMSNLTQENPLALSLYKPLEETEEAFRFKLYRKGATIPLSEVVPMLENMGLRIISERPYAVTPRTPKGKIIESVWVNDYRMIYPRKDAFSIDMVKDIFQDTFASIWKGLAENDGFNRLVLSAFLNWREISVLRAYAKYLWQIGFSFTQSHIEDTFYVNSSIAVELIKLFKLRFDPDNTGTAEQIQAQVTRVEGLIEQVSNLNEDRILRRFLAVMMATVRTNFFQKDQNGEYKSYFSFKLSPALIPEMPLPLPLYEIFVYSRNMEGIHLRGDKVARGGIRWSDRREDFRTEILGLMKAQQVKNAVIVPLGAKGGFIVNRLPENGTREEIMQWVVFCYQTLIRGMLDVTDNLKQEQVVHPPRVVHYDEDDYYLVVAADKGTATFSDTANALAREYGFWLDDAFASGGSTGYDHKKMGITARGAWESVKRHFKEMAFDLEANDFTVVGIGDMSGDVFGNGMLLSKHIKLLAAFNHSHIFLDPNPDPLVSFEERYRLFHAPKGNWSEYDPTKISAGGGVYPRSAKSIPISPEIAQWLGIAEDKMVPNDLIKTILKAKFDLLWNGGIGTFVKASHESQADAGDRTNDGIRVNGKDLACKVVAEGGNLGFTQLGRIEYAKNSGRLNTDAIDNSAGVNCSDNEVNIKILLNNVVTAGDLTEKQRNELLAEMTDEVADLVLRNNRLQNGAISITLNQAVENLEMHSRLLDELERIGHLDRGLEFLPGRDEILMRKNMGFGLTRPEIAVVMAYTKILLKQQIIESTVPEDPYINRRLEEAFPVPLRQRFKEFMFNHRLKREIIATLVSNSVINEMGITFMSRLMDETGCLPSAIVMAYNVSIEVFDIAPLKSQIAELPTQVSMSVQFRMLHEINRLIRRATRWFLRNRRFNMDIQETIQQFAGGVAQVNRTVRQLKSATSHGSVEELAAGFMNAGVPQELSYRVAAMGAMFSALDIVEAANQYKFPIERVTAVYFAVGAFLELGWFREQIKMQAINNRWEALARASIRDDIDKHQRNLTIAILSMKDGETENIDTLIQKWFEHNKPLVERWRYFISELKSTFETEFTMFAIALRELVDMAQLGDKRPH